MIKLWRSAAALALIVSSIALGATGYPLLEQPAPDFALHGFSGRNVRLSEHRGEVVVLAFWSTGCTPCWPQLRALDRSFATYRSAGLQVYGIGVDDDPAQAREFVARHRVGFEMLADPRKDVSRRYAVDNLPMAVLIDRSGLVRQVYREFGAQNEARYLRELRRLLNE